MTQTEYTSAVTSQRTHSAANATWGMGLIALALALLLGLSAADINRHDRQSGAEPQTQHLDGRGKWAGYQ